MNNNNYEKPKVIIDLDEYNRLKEEIKDIQYNTVIYLKERIAIDYMTNSLKRLERTYTVGNISEHALMEYLNNVLGIVKLNIVTNDGSQVELQLRNEKEMR